MKNITKLAGLAAFGVVSAAANALTFAVSSNSIVYTDAMGNPGVGSPSAFQTPSYNAPVLVLTPNVQLKAGDGANVSSLTATWWAKASYEQGDALIGNVSFYAPITINQGYYQASITERIEDVNGNLLAEKTVNPVLGDKKVEFNLSFDPQLAKDGFVVKKTVSFGVPPLFDLQPGERFSDNAIGIGAIEQNFTPVPEPASMAVLGLGIVGIVARRRRK